MISPAIIDSSNSPIISKTCLLISAQEPRRPKYGSGFMIIFCFSIVGISGEIKSFVFVITAISSLSISNSFNIVCKVFGVSKSSWSQNITNSPPPLLSIYLNAVFFAMTCPLLRSCLMTIQPKFWAISAVLSVEPSSTTIICVSTF